MVSFQVLAVVAFIALLQAPLGLFGHMLGLVSTLDPLKNLVLLAIIKE